jgi:hypothetical protein
MRQVASIILSKRRVIPEDRTLHNYRYQHFRSKYKFIGAFSPGCKNRDKSKAMPITGHADPQSFDTSRLPHYLDSRLTDGCDVFSLTRQPAVLDPQEFPGTHFR